VIGEPLAQAKRTIRAARLGIGRIIRQSSSQFAAGEVINTSPFAGQTPPVGTKVDLFVSTGPAKVAVPDVTNKTTSQAEATLTSAGFKVTPVPQASSTATPNTVISQSPSGGTPEVPGSTVTIFVAKAPTATVPDVKGETAAAASSKLKQAGFTVVQQPKNVTDKSQNGIVLNQSPSHGTAKKGSTVTITVGHYVASPPPSTTPSTTPTTTTPVP
jgi:serine/threonine-protein kinase